MVASEKPSESSSLRERVERLLPEWQAWYANLFDAACDLGILRARVCDLSTLVLSRRHASVQNEALQAFRERWSVEEPEKDADQHEPRRLERKPGPRDESAGES